MESLRSEQTYAIVDIEATGGSVGADERIIQFACVLLQNDEVIHTFETFINPGRNIPRNIKQLTGISNKDVRRAPYFEEVAPVILRLLEGTIFVAHNVGFDFRFLNEQLKLHDFETLTIPAIDTVELTQILFPTLDSFQLEDIASSLGYDLVDAHDALADAEATVHIFKELFIKATNLPLVTLEKLEYLSACTTHDTFLFFEQALVAARRDLKPLSEDLVVVNQIAMQQPKHFKNGNTFDFEVEYPRFENEKKGYLNNGFSYREVQANMMDLTYDYFQSDFSLEKLAIEAPPGVGKSLGYLFPSMFVMKPKEPVVVSTYTTVLQDQLLHETLPILENMLNRKVNTALVKSSNHYLSLTIFERWLNKLTADDSEAYLCMRILVWLIETMTGDLSEINAGSHLDLIFWQDIRSTKNQYIDEYWKNYDFYERIKLNTKHAELIITNHHYLAHDWKNNDPVLSNIEKLVVDEAHHFADVATESSTIKLKGNELTEILDKMGSLSNETGMFKLIYLLSQTKKIKKHDMQVLARNTTVLQETWNNFNQDLMNYFTKQNVAPRKDSNFVEHEFNLDILTIKQKRWRKSILLTTQELVITSQKIIKQAYKIFDDLAEEHQLMLIEFSNLIARVTDWHGRFKHTLSFDKNAPNVLRWVSYLPNNTANSFHIHVLKWGEQNSIIDYLATHSKVIFTSSTLSFQDSEDYFSGQLKNLPMKFYQFDSPFDYDHQARIMLPKDRINPKDVHKNEYTKLLARNIGQILSDTKVNTIVLFRSLEVLEEVYHILMEDKKLIDHLILAQSISGTRNRILKNFKRNKPAVILGADSFFEGIDLPDEELELVILTRLPFPAPNTPLTKLKTDYLQEQGLNPFLGELLPQAVLKYKQAFGRLIRNKTDLGVMVVLDDRILSGSYSDTFIEALPSGVPIEIHSNKQLGKQIQQFLDSKDSKE